MGGAAANDRNNINPKETGFWITFFQRINFVPPFFEVREVRKETLLKGFVMKFSHIITLIAAFLLFCSSLNAAQKIGFGWSQDYKLWGFDVYNEDYVHPGASVELDGIEIATVSHVREDEDWQYWDTAAAVKVPIGDLYLRPGYGYYILPGMDVQAFSLTLGAAGAVAPRYTATHLVPDIADSEGQIHDIGVDIDIGVPVEGISALFSADIVYNDHVNVLGGAEVSGWTHATAGLVLDVPFGELSFRPGVVYQHTFEPDALRSDRNEVWATASVCYRF